MIYQHLLPDTVRLGKQYYFNLAILQTSASIYDEILGVMRHKSCLALKVQDRESHLLSLWWIKNLGDDLAPKIRMLETESWLEVLRGPNRAVFQRCRLCFTFGNGPSEFTVKCTFPDSIGSLTHNYRLSCLVQRPAFSIYLQQVMAEIQGEEDNITMSMETLNSIVEAVVKYSEYGYLKEPTSAYLARIQRPGAHLWNDPNLQYWTYLYPAEHRIEPVVDFTDEDSTGGPSYNR
ncbi:MAG: hypothetical protein LQ346_008693 [Caloplaca aetnensis]|nr:MAG: hypothetical protein LQ346_008693 [Caloplaca aetnensis]